MRIKIADTEIDFDQMTTFRGGHTAALTRQTLGILRALHSAGGEIVSKDELIEQVWNGRIITDATLSTAIKEARRAVGDSGNVQRVIKTVHGVGFRMAAPIDATPVNATMPVIAVFPFRAVEETRKAELLAEGLTQETISALSAFTVMRVLSMRTTEHFAKEGLSPEELHEKHGVDVIVEGRVREVGGNTRATVQLIDAASGRTLGSEKVTRKTNASGFFEIEEELGRLIAGRVGSNHGAVAEQMLCKRRTKKVNSLDAYVLQAEFDEWYRSYDVARHAELRSTLSRALEREQGVSCLWSSYSLLLLEEYRYKLNARPGVDALALATEAALRALECHRNGAYPHSVLALIRFYNKDIPGFRAAAERALELNPNNSDILAEVGSCFAMLGEEDRAIELLDQAMELSPVHPGWYHYPRCWRYAREGYFEAALVEIDKVPMPGFLWYHAHLAWFLAELDRTVEAVEQARIVLEIDPEFETTIHDEQLKNNYHGGLIEASIAGWRKAGLDVRLPA
ncbi:winged helix-turn-helix domain-containing protein [Ruegeria sp. R13_0]|uniref:winged helix-turn-helix domain-containing protein n=1 Tax=Ruegeria sp. R13_0 TaxID=2821099 RepID=UPI001ADCE3E7|nr:winged helix-turn-helix domain-containing protein [Ruegeria sp. R13_0]MBO9436951.1 winged helix-turn-helix domain-containing protein [Ruegeria sp. R13_0]